MHDRGNNEAAKYRRKLREVEGQRDQLTEQLNTIRRTVIDRQVKALGYEPEGFWAGGAELEQFLNDEGHINDEAVETTAREIAARLGLQGRRFEGSADQGRKGSQSAVTRKSHGTDSSRSPNADPARYPRNVEQDAGPGARPDRHDSPGGTRTVRQSPVRNHSFACAFTRHLNGEISHGNVKA